MFRYAAKAQKPKPNLGHKRSATVQRRVQAKLTVGAPGDRYEQEADRVADRVMGYGGKFDISSVSIATGGPEQVQREEDEERVQAKAEGSSLSLSRQVARGIEAARGGGAPLPPAARSLFESRFQCDFANVRVHDDGGARAMASELGAHAFTVGHDVFFNTGRYEPDSQHGRWLLAHELTHVLQQRGGAKRVQRDSAQSPAPNPADKAKADEATALETEILAHDVYKKLASDSKARVTEIITIAKTKPLGDAQGQRNYYMKKLKVAITTPFKGTETGKAEYGCSPEAEKQNKEEVEKALKIEELMGGFEADLEEKVVATGTKKVPRIGEQGKIFYVDRSDPRNIRVQIKVKLIGKKEEVESIKKLEDAIERKSYTEGYWLDIVFVDTTGTDVFEFKVAFCEWANSGNWASGPVTLSHEVHHALGLGDRYDYIESHAHNQQMNVPMRLVWFLEQMKKAGGPRDPFSKMDTSSNPLLSEDICAVAFKTEAERKKCIDARKDLDPPGIPPI